MDSMLAIKLCNQKKGKKRKRVFRSDNIWDYGVLGLINVKSLNS
jgi:hypothetical protein